MCRRGKSIEVTSPRKRWFKDGFFPPFCLLYTHTTSLPHFTAFSIPAAFTTVAMKLTQQLIPFSLLTLSSALSPALSKPRATITPPNRYYLKTSVVGTGNSNKNGLYVSGYHIGAGLADATLEAIDSASVGFLNGTQQQFDYGTDFPTGMTLKQDNVYAGASCSYCLKKGDLLMVFFCG